MGLAGERHKQLTGRKDQPRHQIHNQMTTMPKTLTPAQFEALAELSSYKKRGNVREAMRLHFVDGLTLGDAARQTGTIYRHCWSAAKKLEHRYALVMQAAGITV